MLWIMIYDYGFLLYSKYWKRKIVRLIMQSFGFVSHHVLVALPL